MANDDHEICREDEDGWGRVNSSIALSWCQWKERGQWCQCPHANNTPMQLSVAVCFASLSRGPYPTCFDRGGGGAGGDGNWGFGRSSGPTARPVNLRGKYTDQLLELNCEIASSAGSGGLVSDGMFGRGVAIQWMRGRLRAKCCVLWRAREKVE